MKLQQLFIKLKPASLASFVKILFAPQQLCEAPAGVMQKAPFVAVRDCCGEIREIRNISSQLLRQVRVAVAASDAFAQSFPTDLYPGESLVLQRKNATQINSEATAVLRWRDESGCEMLWASPAC